MKPTLVISATLLGAVLGFTPLLAETVIDPDREFVRILHNQLSGAVPDFTLEAQKSDAYRRADEFSRATVLQEQVSILKARYENISLHDKMVINVRSELGEWDAARNAFPVQLFQPNSYIGLGPGISFSNSIEARYWALPLEIAKTVPQSLDPNGYSRNALIEVHLENFHIAVNNDRFLSAEVSLVVVKSNNGEELGRYTVAAPRETIVGADNGTIARGISEKLSVPQIGTELTDALSWATENFDGVAWDVISFSNSMPFDGFDDNKFKKFVLTSDEVIVSFANSDERAVASFPDHGFSLDRVTNSNMFGANLDCGTPDLADRCGFMVFKMVDGEHELVDLLILSDFDQTNFKDVSAGIAGSDLSAFSYNETTSITVGGAGRSPRKFQGELYFLGQQEKGDVPRLPLRKGYRNVINAPVMLYNFDGGSQRAVSIIRLSALPDGSNVIAH